MERAFCDAGVDARCLTVDVTPERLSGAIEGMRAMGFRGGVIAAPHNEPVCELLDELSPTAQFLGRVDSIFRDDDGRFIGDHTLGAAVMATIESDLAGRTAIVCGTGPEAQSICRALAETSLARLVIAGTAADHGEALVERLQEFAKPEIAFERTSHNVDFEPDAQIVIHAGHLEDSDDYVPDPVPLATHLNSSTIAIDLPYRMPRTEFLESAALVGCQIIDGVDVMVCRVNKAFLSWTGNEANVASLRDAVEEFFMI
jgi:shikimate dehydrogenase